jgi:hypothetical protein
MFAIRVLILALTFAVSADARVTTFSWNNGSDWPAGTTVELCVNNSCIPGLEGESYQFDAPIYPGYDVNAKARAYAPGYMCGDPLVFCEYSDWIQVYVTLPSNPLNVSITKEQTTMAAPTFVAQYATAFNSTTSPKTAMSAVAINSGDVLVAVSAEESDTAVSETENGTASWVNLQNFTTVDYTATRASRYIATGNENLTVTFTCAGNWFGGNVIRFSGSAGIGGSNIANGSSGNPSVSYTTTQANSALVVISGDWNARSGTQTFTSSGGAGSPTDLTDYPGDSSKYGVAIAYYPDAGAVGSKTVGMSAPTGQKWVIIVVEVLGTAGAATNVGNIMDGNTLRGLTFGRTVR